MRRLIDLLDELVAIRVHLVETVPGFAGHGSIDRALVDIATPFGSALIEHRYIGSAQLVRRCRQALESDGVLFGILARYEVPMFPDMSPGPRRTWYDLDPAPNLLRDDFERWRDEQGWRLP